MIEDNFSKDEKKFYKLILQMYLCFILIVSQTESHELVIWRYGEMKKIYFSSWIIKENFVLGAALTPHMAL